MSIKIMSKVWEQSSHEGSPLLLLLALADHASDDGVCWPGIPRLAHKTRKTERHTKRLLVKLEESGEVYIAREVGRGNTNMYYITLGFDEEEMVHTLIKRFEFEPDKASEIAQQIIERQIKGDAQDTFSGDGEDEKGDIQGQEKVTPGVEKVTPRDGKGDKAMSPESSSTVIKPSVRNRQEDVEANFFIKNPAPSPGGGADSGKEHEHEIEASNRTRHSDGNHIADTGKIQPPVVGDGDSNNRGGRDGGLHAGADPVVESIADDFLNKPSPEDLARRTAAARAEAGGNWADAGEDGADVAEAALVRFCQMQGEAPNDDERESMLHELAETLKPLRVTVEIVDLAFQIMAADFGYRVGNYNVFQDSFKRDLATCIRRARGGKKQKKPSAHYARTAELAAESQAAFEERMAARDPPVEDDKIGGAIKAELRGQMSALEYDTFVKLTRFACNDGELVIIAPTAFNKDWLENRLELTIRRALRGFTDGPKEVRFEVQS